MVRYEIRKAVKNYSVEFDEKILLKIPKSDYQSLMTTIKSTIKTHNSEVSVSDEDKAFVKSWLESFPPEEFSKIEGNIFEYYGLLLLFQYFGINDGGFLMEMNLERFDKEKADSDRNAELITRGEERLFKCSEYDRPYYKKTMKDAEAYIAHAAEKLREAGYAEEDFR
jgi:hypothetical protein